MFKEKTLRLFRNHIAPLGLACCLLSCSIKEDRMPCPCYLCVTLNDKAALPEGSSVGLLGWNDGMVFANEVELDLFNPAWIKAVHKQMMSVSAWRGAREGGVSGHYAMITPGTQCDSLYAYHCDVDATGETVKTDVTFRKQFCTVHLDIMKRASEMKDYRFTVEGNTCGFDLLDFTPVEGAFRYDPVAEEGARIVDFRIPRQTDDSLSLLVWYKDADGSFQLAGSFPLGKYIVRTGYDWRDENLQDVYVMIDLILGQVFIIVEGWEDGDFYQSVEQ